MFSFLRVFKNNHTKIGYLLLRRSQNGNKYHNKPFSICWKSSSQSMWVLRNAFSNTYRSTPLSSCRAEVVLRPKSISIISWNKSQINIWAYCRQKFITFPKKNYTIKKGRHQKKLWSTVPLIHLKPVATPSSTCFVFSRTLEVVRSPWITLALWRMARVYPTSKQMSAARELFFSDLEISWPNVSLNMLLWMRF